MRALASLLLVLVLPAVAGAVLLSGGSRLTSGKVTPEQISAGRAVPDAMMARGLACGLATWLLGSGLLTATVGLTSSSAWAWDGLVAAVSLGVLVVPLGYTIVHTSWSPIGSTPWYYYGLARQVADAGSIPAASIEFGTATP